MLQGNHSDKGKTDFRSSVQFAHRTVRAEASARLYEIFKAWQVAVRQISDVEGLYATFILNTMPKSAASVAKHNKIGNVWGLDDDKSLISKFKVSLDVGNYLN